MSAAFTFSKPITVIDQQVASVTLREPTGADLVKAGDPAQTVAYGFRLAEILANLPSGTVGKLPARDALALSRLAVGFLADDPPPTSSIDTSRSGDGGATSEPS